MSCKIFLNKGNIQKTFTQRNRQPGFQHKNDMEQSKRMPFSYIYKKNTENITYDGSIKKQEPIV